jgi:Tol biopolymer transport system component
MIMSGTTLYRPVLFICAIVLLLSARPPAAAQPTDTKLFLPLVARAPQGRIAYFGGGNGSEAVLGVVNLGDGARAESRFTINYRSDNTSYAWSPTAPNIAFNEYHCAPQSGRPFILCSAEAVVIARANGTLTRIAGDYIQPRWSPDGQRLLFVGASLDVIGADGNGRRTLVAQAGVFGPSWSPDGQLVAYTLFNQEGTLAVVSADGGSPRVLDTDVSNYIWSPVGNYLAVDHENGSLSVINADTGAKTPISANGYSSSWSPDGALLAFGQSSAQGQVITIVGRDGRAPRVLGVAMSVIWAPDMARVALSPYGSDETIVVVALANGARQTLPVKGFPLAWSPDSRLLAIWGGSGSGSVQIFSIDGSAVTTVENIDFAGGGSWSPDGGWLSLLNRVQTPDNVSSVRLLAAARNGITVDALPGPYGFRIEAFRWLPK